MPKPTERVPKPFPPGTKVWFFYCPLGTHGYSVRAGVVKTPILWTQSDRRGYNITEDSGQANQLIEAADVRRRTQEGWFELAERVIDKKVLYAKDLAERLVQWVGQLRIDIELINHKRRKKGKPCRPSKAAPAKKKGS